jgi:hypothetical protein
MLKCVLADLSLSSKIEPFIACDAPKLLEEYSKSSKVVNVFEALENPAHSALATAEMYLDQRSEVIELTEDWNSIALRVDSVSGSISSSGSDSYVYVYSAKERVKIKSYEIVGFPSLGDIPQKMSLKHLRDDYLSQGQLYYIKAGGFAIQMLGAVDSFRFLRINSAIKSEYVVSFDAGTLEMKSIAMSDGVNTARLLFATLLTAVMQDTLGARSSRLVENLAHDLPEFLQFGLNDDTNISAKWKLLQVAGRYHPILASNWLTEIAHSHLPKASALAKQILNLESPQHAHL